MAVEWCKPCKDRGRLSIATREVADTPMCDACFKGQPAKGVPVELAPAIFSTTKEEMAMRKRTDVAVQTAIRRDAAAGMSVNDIAAKHKVSWPTAKRYAGGANGGKHAGGGASQKLRGRSARPGREIFAQRHAFETCTYSDAGTLRRDLGGLAA